jgi:hypothetical protein
MASPAATSDKVIDAGDHVPTCHGWEICPTATTRRPLVGACGSGATVSVGRRARSGGGR